MKLNTSIYYFSLIALFIFSCTNTQNKTIVTNKDSTSVISPKDSIHDDISYYEGESEETDFYVIVCDSGADYFSLRNKMIEIAETGKVQIDSLERYFNAEKNELILPEKHEDQMYAGAYYPRRFEGDFLSIEYLNQYHKNSNDKTLAIIAGIFANKNEAEQRKMLLNQNGFLATNSKCRLYTGCMH